MRNQRGFTIYELMIVIVILGLALAIGAPSLADFTQNNRTAGQVNDMVTALVSARSEALSRGRSVAVVPLGGVWDDGWQVIVDVNRDGDFIDAQDELVRQYDGLNEATMTVSGANIVFESTGWPEAARTVTIVANECRQQNRRQITMSNTGILTTTKLNCP